MMTHGQQHKQHSAQRPPLTIMQQHPAQKKPSPSHSHSHHAIVMTEEEDAALHADDIIYKDEAESSEAELSE
jgi:hypothetical protein